MVAPEYLEQAWPYVQEHLKRAVDGSIGGELTLQNVFDQLLTGQQLLWVVYQTDDREVIAAGTVQSVEYRSGRTAAQFVMLGGKNATRWLDQLIAAVEDWARERGLDRLEATGRRGWLRKLGDRGWRETYVMMTKDLDNGERQP